MAVLDRVDSFNVSFYFARTMIVDELLYQSYCQSPYYFIDFKESSAFSLHSLLSLYIWIVQQAINAEDSIVRSSQELRVD